MVGIDFLVKYGAEISYINNSISLGNDIKCFGKNEIQKDLSNKLNSVVKNVNNLSDKQKEVHVVRKSGKQENSVDTPNNENGDIVLSESLNTMTSMYDQNENFKGNDSADSNYINEVSVDASKILIDVHVQGKKNIIPNEKNNVNGSAELLYIQENSADFSRLKNDIYKESKTSEEYCEKRKINKYPDGIVLTKNNLYIPARSQVICEGIRSCLKKNSGSVLIEPVETSIHGVMVARVVTKDDRQEVPMKLMNVSEKELFVPKNTIIGIEEVITKIEESRKTTSETVLAIDECNFTDRFNMDHLKCTDQVRLRDLLTEYQDIFMQPGTKLGCTSKVKHKIITENVNPIARRPYRVPYTQQGVVTKIIEDLENDTIIKKK